MVNMVRGRTRRLLMQHLERVVRYGNFEDWFFSCLLPKLKKKQDGTKVLIGDNMSSRINSEVIKACAKYKIRFLCLPANSSHIIQPLDVAYFALMKSMWRKILTTWKESEYGRILSNIPKDVFPTLLIVTIFAKNPIISCLVFEKQAIVLWTKIKC